ncbi:uncharacterized protein BCR38DRAFT_447867 [Pseudomassariella vexata]|uniref:Uncharacterized protein n=1 Tax=Pseudomassariella vexata TaxID=1141098 RepID=A0A1Y2DG50_9PEZI|nr:uncharacterized protein BCR38DRAFT_447867 [Pseudomassariella vexata]ORY58054.1 hypothetical protein BCR38DRAFT_447867 [Pseudomassariella vexata]
MRRICSDIGAYIHGNHCHFTLPHSTNEMPYLPTWRLSASCKLKWLLRPNPTLITTRFRSEGFRKKPWQPMKKPTSDEMQRVYLAYRDYIPKKGPLIFKRDVIKELQRWAEVMKSVQDINETREDRVAIIVRRLLKQGVFQSEEKARAMFPQAFKTFSELGGSEESNATSTSKPGQDVSRNSQKPEKGRPGCNYTYSESPSPPNTKPLSESGPASTSRDPDQVSRVPFRRHLRTTVHASPRWMLAKNYSSRDPGNAERKLVWPLRPPGKTSHRT